MCVSNLLHGSAHGDALGNALVDKDRVEVPQIEPIADHGDPRRRGLHAVQRRPVDGGEERVPLHLHRVVAAGPEPHGGVFAQQPLP